MPSLNNILITVCLFLFVVFSCLTGFTIKELLDGERDWFFWVLLAVFPLIAVGSGVGAGVTIWKWKELGQIFAKKDDKKGDKK